MLIFTRLKLIIHHTDAKIRMHTFSYSDYMHNTFILTANLWQYNQAFLKAFNFNTWILDCGYFRSSRSKVSHNSCDNYNCQSAILEARLIMQFKIPNYCHKHIASEPTQACTRSPKCLQFPKSRQKLEPRLRAYAGLKTDILRDNHCREYFGNLTFADSNSCSDDDCAFVHLFARAALESMIPDGCHKHIIQQPSCVKYDCNHILS